MYLETPLVTHLEATEDEESRDSEPVCPAVSGLFQTQGLKILAVALASPASSIPSRSAAFCSPTRPAEIATSYCVILTACAPPTNESSRLCSACSAPLFS